MSSKAAILASSGGLLNLLDQAPLNTSELRDIEMIFPLTSTNDHSSKILSSSPTTSQEMSFQSARDRNERLNSSRENNIRGNQNNTNGNQGYPPQMGPPMATPYVPRPRGNSVMSGIGIDSSVPLSSVIPGPAWPSEEQLSVSHGYCVQREDGSYTRLLRADQIPNIVGIDQSQGPEGLIVLPTPRQLSPRRRQGDPPVPREVANSLPTLNSLRPTVHHYDATQMQIDAIISSQNGLSPPQSARPAQRREKIYCDKWIHEGVCAFTQMGCKYKHVMPTDRATQISLGLNHGFPNWYRRDQGVGALSSPQQTPQAITSVPHNTPGHQNRLSGPWRRTDTGAGPSGFDAHSGSVGNNLLYGPIGPPTHSHPTRFSNNPFDVFQDNNGEVKSEDEANQEEDTITFSGRYH